MAAYEALHYDKDQLKEACESVEGWKQHRVQPETCVSTRASVFQSTPN